MPLSKSDVLDAVKTISAGRSKGPVAWVMMERRLKQGGVTGAQREFAAEVVGLPRHKPGTHRHPEDSNVVRAARKRGDLDQAELMWLNRLPSDPAQVSHADAEQLAALWKGLGFITSPSSKRLVGSIYGPVKALHDRKSADAELERVKQPLPTIPNSTARALAEALAAESDELSVDDLLGAAQSRIQAIVDRAVADRDKAITRAEKRIVEIEQAVEQQTVLSIDEEATVETPERIEPRVPMHERDRVQPSADGVQDFTNLSNTVLPDVRPRSA